MTLHLCAYAHASIANKDDHVSQIGYVVLLCDSTDNCPVLAYWSKRAHRVVWSIMAEKANALADAFDAACIIKNDLARIYRQHRPLIMRTDLKQMFEVVTKASHTARKRLRIDVAAAPKAYERDEIYSVSFLKAEHQMADGLTNPGPCAALNAVVRKNKDTHPLQHWIVRSPASNQRSPGGGRRG